MTCQSAEILSQVLRYQVAPDGSRNRIRFAVRFRARAIFTDLVCAGDQFGTRSEFWDCPRLLGRSLVCFYCWLYILALRLELRALPSNSRKLFAKSLTKSSIRGIACLERRFVAAKSARPALGPFREKLDQKLSSLAYLTSYCLI